MTISEILGNEELRQQEFPVTRKKIFLSHAAVCPLPRRVCEAVQKYSQECTEGDQEEILPATLIRRTRELAASMLGAQFEEIALVGPTSLGLSFVERTEVPQRRQRPHLFRGLSFECLSVDGPG